MRRAAIGLTVVALAVVLSAGASAAPATGAGRPGRPSVSVDCHPASALSQRYASFSAQMHALPGTVRMGMRFTLLERPAGAPLYRRVPLSKLRPWRRSRAGARTFIYTQKITGLHDGSAYRMHVRFRWFGVHGVLRSASLRSASCRQPPPLPNLTITSISWAPSSTVGESTYSITVANQGGGDAHDVGVALRIDGSPAAKATVDLLPARESALVQIDAPSCSFGVRAVADPDHVIRETDERDNALGVSCSHAKA